MKEKVPERYQKGFGERYQKEKKPEAFSSCQVRVSALSPTAAASGPLRMSLGPLAWDLA